jgi:hypothetical protein
VSYVGLLKDTCQILRRTPGAFDPNTGSTGAAGSTTIYTGACRVAPVSGMAGRVQVSEEAVVNRDQYVFLPFSATGIKSEDIVKVTAHEDADMVNKEMTVRTVSAEASPLTSLAVRWLIAEEIQEGP